MSLALVDAWTARGWLRPLDRAFARFCVRQRPALDAAAVLGAALTSHQVGRGHLCLDLDAALADPAEVLGLPPEVEDTGDVMLPARALQGLTPTAWRASLAPLLEAPAGDRAPLSAFEDRIYLTRYHELERRLAERLLGRLQPVPLSAARQAALAARFPDDDARREAARLSLASRLALISGGPGTGKTTAIARLVSLHQALAPAGERPRIALAAPTGKAAARLQQSMAEQGVALDGGITTLHRLLGARPNSRRMRFDAGNPLHLDLLVVDEASMVDLELMTQTLDALPDTATLVLVGDKDQLASVEPGAVMNELCGERATRLHPHRVMLTENFRFGADSGIGALSRAVNAGDPVAVGAVLTADHGDVALHPLAGATDPALAATVIAGFADYLRLLESGQVEPAAALRALTAFRVLCGPRRGPWSVAAINALLEDALGVREAAARGDGWYHGRPVMVTRNDRQLGLYNGDVGVALRRPNGQLRVWFESTREGDADGVRPLVPNRLTAVETVWAMTVHKSQGSEFDRVALLLPDRPSPLFTRELLYTGITRARSRIALLCGSADALAGMVTRRTHRASGLALRLRGEPT